MGVHGFVHGFVAGVCRVRWFVVAALACWRGRVVLDCVVWCVLLGSLAATGPLVWGVVASVSPRSVARCLLVRGGCPGGVVV